MKILIILVASLFGISTADLQSDENRQALTNGEHVTWGNWIGSMGGPQPFKLEIIEALRSLLENDQLRAELVEVLRSEPESDAVARATEYMSDYANVVCEKTCSWRAPCSDDPQYNPQAHIREVIEENCRWESHPKTS